MNIVRQSRSCCGEEEQRKNVVAVCCNEETHNKLKAITIQTEMAKGIITRSAILRLLRLLNDE